MRTKFSTINDDDQSHHHSEINKNCKNFIYTFKILNNSLFSRTNSNTHLLQNTHPIQKTLSISHLGLKTEKPALHNTNHPHSHSPTSKYSLVRTKFSTVSDDDQSHHYS